MEADLDRESTSKGGSALQKLGRLDFDSTFDCYVQMVFFANVPTRCSHEFYVNDIAMLDDIFF